MKNTIFTLILLTVTGYFISCNRPGQSPIKAPVAKKINQELTIHGHTRVDPYYWLNQRDNPEVIAYLEAENAYTSEMMKHTLKLQDDLYNEIIGRIKQTDISVPYLLNGYLYYTRYDEGREYPIYCRKPEGAEATEEVMLDVNSMAEGYSFFHLGDWDVSIDNQLLVYSVDTVSRRQYTIYVKNLATGEIYPDLISNTSGEVTWANDNLTFFYATKDETLRPYQIYSHRLGYDTGDRLVFQEDDSTFSCSIYKSKSREFLIIETSSTLSSECRINEAGNPDGEFRVFQARENDMLYEIEHFADQFYILTNWNAMNFRLMKTSLDRTAKENWTEVIPHRKDVLLEGIEVFSRFFVVAEKINGLDQLRIFNLESGEDHYIEFTEESYMAFFSTNPEFNTSTFRFSYSSLTTPFSVFDYNMEKRTRELRKQQEVLGGFKPENYETKRIFATAPDGVKVPMSLVYRKGLELNGENPLLIYGYGSYGASSDPYFSHDRLSLLDRGFIFVIAQVRGGQEMGRQWYEDGKLLNKKNTFTDFIACTEHLISLEYTRPEKCFAIGGSAGGLLMGAIANMRPDLYRGIVAEVPFVDVVTTMLDESIPLTTGEYDEWGNPADRVFYDYILSYSPYDQVTSQHYPNMLVTTGLHDSQVQYWEPAKWVAKLRDMKTDPNRLLLFTQMEFGHGGASGRFERYRETALEYAFIFDLAGISK